MKLSARPLIDVQGKNDFIPATEMEIFKGDATTFYFQLLDMEKNLAAHGWNPPGLRYIPAAGATLNVTFLSVDTAKQFLRAATKPFAEDTSIWAVSILASDPLVGTVAMKLALTESGVTRTAFLPAALLVKDINEGC